MGSTSVLGGMIVGIVCMVIFTPVFYQVIQSIAEKLGDGPPQKMAVQEETDSPTGG